MKFTLNGDFVLLIFEEIYLLLSNANVSKDLDKK